MALPLIRCWRTTVGKFATQDTRQFSQGGEERGATLPRITQLKAEDRLTVNMTERIPFCSRHTKEARKAHVCQSSRSQVAFLRNGSTTALWAEALPESANTQEGKCQFQWSFEAKKGSSKLWCRSRRHRAAGKGRATEEDRLIQDQDPVKELQIPPCPNSWNSPLIKHLHSDSF